LYKKCFNEASVLYMFLPLDIRGIDNIRLIYRPIHAPSHELEDTDTNTPPTRAINRRNLVELLGIREECVILYLWYTIPLAYFAGIHIIFRCTDFDTKDGGKKFARNFGNIAHFDTVLTCRI
jgi:hypothetical protein